MKPNIPEAVNICKNAGITVRMVTGDNTDTATAIAKKANIIIESKFKSRPAHEEDPGYFIVMEGEEFRTRTGGLIKVKKDAKELEEMEEEL